MVPGIEQRSVVARDGTRIGYQVRGEGPCVVLANGLGGTHVVFKYLYEALTGYRTICWDYRGLYSSAAPADPNANTVAHQISDLVEILEREQVDDFVIVGWSMGVQVGIETIRRHRARVRGLYAISGTYGRTFRSVMGSRLVGQTIPMVLRLIKAQAPLVSFATRRIAAQPLIAMMTRLGLASDTIDRDVFGAIVQEFAQVDWRLYSDLLIRLDEHDAEDVLGTIDVPVTIVAGGRDLITPAASSQHMHARIAGSRLVVIDGASHYTPVEYPKILVEELGQWLARIPGWDKREAA